MDNKLIHYLQNKNFRKKKEKAVSSPPKRQTTRWSQKETQLFYKALELCGLDFTLISKLFTRKSRKQVKKKYMKEESLNRRKIEEIVKNADFDEDKYNALTDM
ncbi:Transcription initiation factor TFIIIB, Bdp1 subunit [Trachipleistophora hominis]|uniref:Transcription initiation factor TFIIIB, Bdp1 subunit n=1 Tax=Trachipleistophora hominis TaxID=72359 RepID=L7JZN0_TRAHO|nr:Transcription initiation factor TFIIIB, Bdp1 subunit [Trachipleistophora hominis]